MVAGFRPSHICVDVIVALLTPVPEITKAQREEKDTWAMLGLPERPAPRANARAVVQLAPTPETAVASDACRAEYVYDRAVDLIKARRTLPCASNDFASACDVSQSLRIAIVQEAQRDLGIVNRTALPQVFAGGIATTSTSACNAGSDWIPRCR